MFKVSPGAQYTRSRSGERSYGGGSENPVTRIRRESVGGQGGDARVVEADHRWSGPGPSNKISVDKIYRCLDKDNGLLFRLEDTHRRTWYFYNDTTEYVMHVSVTFGNESMVRALGSAKQTIFDEETGHCRIDISVGPGETRAFMRGEFNGFVTFYDAEPIPYDERKEWSQIRPQNVLYSRC